MKSYYQQVIEYNIEVARLDTLIEKRQLLFEKITSCTSTLKDDVVGGTRLNDKMTKYTIECKDLDESIKLQEAIVKTYEANISKMESYFKKLKGTKEKVFNLYFVEGRKPKQVARMIPCSEKNVYIYINKIKEELQ